MDPEIIRPLVKDEANSKYSNFNNHKRTAEHKEAIERLKRSRNSEEKGLEKKTKRGYGRG
jgi:hypothetical protein